MNSRVYALTPLLLCLACTANQPTGRGINSRPKWSAPPLERSVAVQDGRTGRALSFDAFLDALADADVVFLGETHIDETTHRVELAVYEGLLARRNGKVILSMEMFERDVQPDLDAYLAGSINEAEFLSRARPWGNYRTAYRPMIEKARAVGQPVIAANFPRPLRRRIAMEGSEVLESLADEDKHQSPAELFANTPAYWRRVDNAIRSHRVMGGGGGGGDEQRLYSTQSLWDNAMGEACAIALDRYPGRIVLHVNGGFHSAYWDGAVRQLQLRKPRAKVVTVAISPTSNPGVADVGGAPVADYVVFAESRAADLNNGAWSVTVSREQDYRFHLPKGASDANPVPLLIWLSDDGFTASDGMDLWKDRLGEDVAIVVLEPPYPGIQEDLSRGGRWFWADSFASDVGTLVGAVERVWAYLMRYYPIDPARVCVAGEGTGATVVAAFGLLADRMEVEAVALNPRHFSKIKDFSLPLAEYQGDEPPVKKSLRVIAAGDGDAWWTEELGEYVKIGLDAALIPADEDPWKIELAAENTLRAALDIDKRPAVDAVERRYILMESDSPRARHWARLRALRSFAKDGIPVALLDAPPTDETVVRIQTEVRAESFALPGALPPCPGPFGGTTVVVVPDDAPAQEVRAWLALLDDDPLTKHSRFHRLRIANGDGERSLSTVLATLQSEGRENILIVPASFCADGAWLRTLKRSVRTLEDQMTLNWLPGLGGRDVPLAIDTTAATLTPVHHKLSVALTPDQHSLSVEDTVELPRGLSRAGAEFALDAGLTIRSSDPPVTKTASDDEAVSRYTLDAAPTDGVFRITYDGVIDHGLSDQKEEYTHGFRESRGILGPQGVYLHGASAWIPRFSDDLIRFELEVQAPDDWHVVSQGNGTSRDDDGRARWESGGSVEQVYLVGGPMVVQRDSAGAVETLVYLHEKDDALAGKYLDATARYIEMYRKLIAPYPYGKFALVENFWETGYGMPSFTLLGPQVIRFPFILTSSYPHEILHNWWGNSVFVDYESGNWCEGLTAYMADHLIQEQRGQGAKYRRGALQKYRNYVKDGRDFPLSEFRSRHSAATEAVGYGKALMTFHMLRRHTGDDNFRTALADFYRKNRGKRASFDDMRKAFEAVTNEDLRPFFEQWISRTGAPSLALSDVTASEAGDGFTVSGTLKQTQQAEPYALEIPLHVQTEAGVETFVIESDQATTAFTVRVKSRPLSVAADPMFDLFRVLDPREMPASIGQIFGEPQILAVLPASSAATSAADPYRELMQSWQSDEHQIEVVLETELEALPDDRAVWILGRGNRFAEQFLADAPGASMSQSGESLALAGEEVPFAAHSTVVIHRHPRNIEKAVGWLVIDPPAAFAGMARKLPHYGKYSYLAFEGDEPANIVKGQWSTDRSPLVASLTSDRIKPGAAVTRKALAELPPVFSRKALMEHVEWLASPHRAGRGLGSVELKAASYQIANTMEAAGLEPGGDSGSWFQRFTVDEGPDGKPVEAVNVVGVLPGTRDEWSDQSIILSAHYDHLGRGWPDVREGYRGEIHPGADDNASGVAVMLELARNLADEARRSRNLVVIAFSAEEAGRLGSKHYVEHPRFPLDGIRGVINLDTVGRLFDGKIAIHGTGTADEWQHIFRGCGFVTGVPSQNVPGAYEGSDQASFIAKGIPAVQIFTGAHEDYHRPSDTADKIDGAGLVKVATFLKEALTFLLEREPPLTVRIKNVAASSHGEATAAHGQTPAQTGRRVSFGTVPDFAFQGDGVKIEALVPDSPAARAGLKAGDILIRLDDTEIADLRGFSNFLKTLSPGQEVDAKVMRDGAEIAVKVVVQKR
ncbi:MAG: ChaN family lipoprotein [Planctomycetes bacterium]|nr:ChaN family lipoprotein [Planctomycetota bacterium]